MVMMSANPNVHATAAALEMAAVLPKPFTVPALLRMVQRYARERATLVLRRRTLPGAIGAGTGGAGSASMGAHYLWYAGAPSSWGILRAGISRRPSHVPQPGSVTQHLDCGR
jgi:hypothetical protein